MGCIGSGNTGLIARSVFVFCMGCIGSGNTSLIARSVFVVLVSA